MAYSNWGGMVWVDNKARHDLCDLTVKQLFGDERYTVYMQHFVNQDSAMMFHAIVGDVTAGFFICLRKSWISEVWYLSGDKYVKADDKAEFHYIDDEGNDSVVSLEDSGGMSGTFSIADVNVSVTFSESPESITVEFLDKLGMGRRWVGSSGYCMGEGYDDWD